MKVLIVDDHKLFGEVISSVLEEEGMDVQGVATTGAAAMEAVRSDEPDLVLLDIGLPDIWGIDLGKQILEEKPSTKVVAITALSDGRVVREAMKAGFHGYLTKDSPLRNFTRSVAAAAEGQVVMPHRLASAAAGAQSPQERDASLRAGQLSPREREVLSMLVEGAGGDEMAKRLSVSPNTVRTHVQNILTKLQVHTRLEAATYAVRYGIVSPPGEVSRNPAAGQGQS
jgi:two-component system nitrate/nitrite response regulator NarL